MACTAHNVSTYPTAGYTSLMDMTRTPTWMDKIWPELKDREAENIQPEERARGLKLSYNLVRAPFSNRR